MSDYVFHEMFGCDMVSPYDQLFKDIYFSTSPSELKKIEPIIKRNYLLKVAEDDGEGEFDRNVVNVKKSPNVSLWLGVESQYNLDRDPRRLQWLDRLLGFMEERGTPITVSPTLPVNDHQSNLRRPLDLHLLFNLTMAEVGGMKLCTDEKGWGRIARRMKVSTEKSHILRKVYKKFLLPFEEHQKNQVIRPQGQGNNNSAARSQISSSKAEKRRTEVEGENVKWTERVKVKDLRTHLNNNRWSVFTRLGGAGHNNNRKKWRSRNRKN